MDIRKGKGKGQDRFIIVLASGNEHKIREFVAIIEESAKKMMEGFDGNICEVFSILSYENILGKIEIIENGTSFKENALIKAQTIYYALEEKAKTQRDSLARYVFDMPFAIIAEDSGICVDILDGLPGIYSARYKAYQYAQSNTDIYQACNSNDEENLAALVNELKIRHLTHTKAHFRAHIALLYVGDLQLGTLEPKVDTLHFEGVLDGEVIDEARGAGGFGYDPIFVPESLSKTLAELSSQDKNSISHRSKALQGCIDYLMQKNMQIKQNTINFSLQSNPF